MMSDAKLAELEARISELEAVRQITDAARKFNWACCGGFNGVQAGRMEALDNLAVDKTKTGGYFVKLRLRQSAADSSRPEFDVATRGERQLSLHNDVGEIQASARPQHPVDFAKRSKFIGRQIEDFVGNHYVHAFAFHRQLFGDAAANLDVLPEPGCQRRPLGALDHSRSHVDTDRPSLWTAAANGDQKIHAGATTDVQNTRQGLMF